MVAQSTPSPGVQVEDDAVGLLERATARIHGVELDHIPLCGRQQARLGGHLQQRRMCGVQRRVELANPRHLFIWGMFLEELLRIDATGRTQQRHGAALAVRQHQRTHLGVVAHQFQFGRARAGVDHPVSMGHPQLGG
jgi:hypothetical protein